MAEQGRHRVWKALGWTLGIVVLLLVLLPLSLYIPWVQNAVKDYACRWASEATGLDIKVGRVLIEFPLDVSVDDVLVLDADRDTMVRAANFKAGIEVLPLLQGRVNVADARLTDGSYRMTTDDGAMRLKADVRHCDVDGIAVDLLRNRVNLGEATLRGGDVDLVYCPYLAVDDRDTTQAAPWHVEARKLIVEDVNYTMQMLPTIDKLQAYVGHATLHDGKVDTGGHLVDATALVVDSVRVDYVYLGEADAKRYDAAHVPVDTLPPLVLPGDTVPWTVRADSVRLTRAAVRYARQGAIPAGNQALDPDYIQIDNLDLALDNVYNRDTDVRFTIVSAKADERSGLALKRASGRVDINDRGIDLSDIKMGTMLSDINLDGHIDRSMLDNSDHGQMHLKTDSRIALQEVGKLMPSLRPTLNGIPQRDPLSVKADIAGNTRRIDINSATLDMPRYAHATLSGSIVNPTDSKRMSGDLALDARFDNINWVKPTLLDKATQPQVNLPPMSLKGTAHLNGEAVTADAVMTVNGGRVVGKSSFNSRSGAYDLDATFSQFPVKAVLPLAGVDNLTGRVRARGQGFDFGNPSTGANLDVDLASLGYNRQVYRDIHARVNLNDGKLSGRLLSDNDNCRVNADFDGSIVGDHYVLSARGRADRLDLRALGLYDGRCEGSCGFAIDGEANLKDWTCDATVQLTDVDWMLDNDRMVANKVDATLVADENGTQFSFENEDNHLRFSSPSDLRTLADRFALVGRIAGDQYERRYIQIDTLQRAMPPFSLSLDMGANGFVQRFVDRYEMDFRRVTCEIRNDSSLFANGKILALSVGTTNIDTITFKAGQWHNRYLAFALHMGNRRGTMDEFARVDVEGGILGSTVDFLVRQHNIDGELGYRIGCNATLTDSALNMRLFPKQPIVGYRQWQVNEGNYINYDYRTRMIDADLSLKSDTSLISLHTTRAPGATRETITVDFNRVFIEEWTRFLPSVTPMSGMVDADIDLSFDGKNVEGTGLLKLSNFVYDGRKQGDFELSTKYAIDPATASTRLTAEMMVDNSRVAMAFGALNDTTTSSPLNLTLSLDRFPLRKVSPFIPGKMLLLRGYANGEMTVTGTMDHPLANGWVVGDSAQVVLPRYGAYLTLDTARVPVVNSTIDFKDYRLIGSNDSPVLLNGRVDMSDFAAGPAIDLSLKGRKVQLVNSEQRTFSEVFGKAFGDIDATVRSVGDNMAVNANVKVLRGSNITYVMQDEINSLSSKVDENMVTFVNLSDSTDAGGVLRTAAAVSGAISIQADIEVEPGVKITAYLSQDGNNRATVDGTGRLKYTLDFAGKDNLRGTYTVDEGNVRYTPPLISQKTFDIVNGGTITWNGDMLNPQLNLQAVEHVKTSVSSSEEGSRMVEFTTTATLTGTLNNMQLSFDLTADGDLTTQNELQSMSEAQRSQAAINLLLYNTYSGTSSGGNINNVTASSALFSFLQSQLNSWAAKTLKGVDLTFGINQYGSTKSGGLETSYSYRLSKTLFDDRFKIVVGGEYSTDASAEVNFAQNLLNDISFEYLLNESGSKYVRLFRHQKYESLLEGQITEMGVAFVMKRKLGTLRHLFRYKSPQRLLEDSIKALRKAHLKAIEDAEKSIVNVGQANDSLSADSLQTIPPINRKNDDEDF